METAAGVAVGLQSKDSEQESAYSSLKGIGVELDSTYLPNADLKICIAGNAITRDICKNMYKKYKRGHLME